MLPVLNGDVQRVPGLIEIGDNRRETPIAIAIDDIAAVTIAQQHRIEPGVVRPGLRVRADPGRLGGGRDLLFA